MEYWAAGKLLLFGEYLVLRGAKCLSIPLKMGQSLKVIERKDKEIHWLSTTSNQPWFSATFSQDLEIIQSNDEKTAQILLDILRFIRFNNPNLFELGLDFTTNINFRREWGFGTSSTLISLLNQWSGVNAYSLLANSFGGSGYDVASATANTPIVYEFVDHQVTSVIIHRPIIQRLLFVYLGKKQDSHKEVAKFSNLNIPKSCVQEMNHIVDRVVATHDIVEFEQLIYQSENLIGTVLQQPTLKNKYFADYPYAIKSLGAWGGDFFMATFRDEEEARFYFLERGYQVQFNYFEVIRDY